MTEPPKRVADLFRAIAALSKELETTERRLVALVGNVALSQMLPDSAIKGGTGLKLRFGERLTRDTPDVDAAFRGDLDEFRDRLAENLAVGWGGFTGTVTRGAKRGPDTVPEAYVMQPFRVALKYHGRTFKGIDLEVGYDELEATTSEEPEFEMSEVLRVFATLGLLEPAPARVQPLHHQIAQKIHACTAPRSDRAHDLVDLQMIVPLTDAALVATTTKRLFRFRAEHEWPPTLTAGADWEPLYGDAVEGLEVLPTVAEAVAWLNDYIHGLASEAPAGRPQSALTRTQSDHQR
jgi:hypothetical protein